MSANTQFQQIIDLMARTKTALDTIAAAGGLTSAQADTVIAGMTIIAVQAESLAGGGAPPLTISGISPNPVSVGANVTISGAGFGASQGRGTVAFNGVPATAIVSWSATSIVATVPGPAVSTTGFVTVINDAGKSAVISLVVQ